VNSECGEGVARFQIKLKMNTAKFTIMGIAKI